jgi:uncharacterized protein (DUF433 family)
MNEEFYYIKEETLKNLSIEELNEIYSKLEEEQLQDFIKFYIAFNLDKTMKKYEKMINNFNFYI